MANLKIFVSSTCYDLSVVRDQLRQFIQALGHEPVMSEDNDVVYDPRTHTHTSCINEIASADAVVVIIGSRFGGQVVPEALQKVDLDALQSISKSNELLNSPKNLSITQLEVLRAIELSIPVFAFVDASVMNDHATYEKNKDKAIADEIEYHSIEKPKTAKYIFEFINFLRQRSVNNGITPFARLQDVEDALRRQWSGLFQRLLLEQRSRALDGQRIDSLTNQFEDLKIAILSSVGGSKDQKEIVRCIVRFRRLIEFVLAFDDGYALLTGPLITWAKFLESVNLWDIMELPLEPVNADWSEYKRTGYVMLSRDRTIFEVDRAFDDVATREEWADYMRLGQESRKVIVDALAELRLGTSARPCFRHLPMSHRDYLRQREAALLSVLPRPRMDRQ